MCTFRVSGAGCTGSAQRLRSAESAVGAIVSLAIESIQLFTTAVLSSGRTPDINDLIANTLGAMIGYGVLTLARAVAPNEVARGG